MCEVTWQTQGGKTNPWLQCHFNVPFPVLGMTGAYWKPLPCSP